MSTPRPPSSLADDPGRRRLLQSALAAGAALLPLATAPVVAQPGRLRVALVPYLSARAMLSVYEPLRKHLERHVGRELEFHTAASFRALAESARSGESPFTLMPMHLARIAVADWGQALVARSTRLSPVQLLVPRALGLKRPDALRGRRIAAIDPLSITSLMLQRWLATEQLEGAIEVVHVPSANAAAMALSRGEVVGMVVAQGQALDVPGMRPEELEPLVQVGSTLTPCFVAHPRVPSAELLGFRRALLSFDAPGAAGASAASGTSGGASFAQFVEGAPRDLEPYEPYAALARRMLALPGR